MSSFKDFRSQYPEAPKGVTGAHALSLSCNSKLPARNDLGFLPQGYCVRKTLKP